MQSVKRISISEKDEKILKAELKIKSDNQPDNYKDLVVIKPWGYEFLFFENEYVAAWLLYIKKDHATSMHAHPQKVTSLSVLMGDAFCNTFYTRNFMEKGESVIIPEGVFHSTKALSYDGIFIIEIESPPNKADLVRFKDNYGRKHTGYENTSQMIKSNLDNYNYFYIDNDYKFRSNKLTKLSKLDIEEFYEDDLLSGHNFDESCTYTILEGKIEAQIETIATAGESIYGKTLNEYKAMFLRSKLVLLKTTGFNLDDNLIGSRELKITMMQ